MNKSIEILTHFRCDGCQKWWSIGDAPADKKVWYCPWCGLSHTNLVSSKPDRPVKIEVITQDEIREAIKREEAKGIKYKTNIKCGP